MKQEPLWNKRPVFPSLEIAVLAQGKPLDPGIRVEHCNEIWQRDDFLYAIGVNG